MNNKLIANDFTYKRHSDGTPQWYYKKNMIYVIQFHEEFHRYKVYNMGRTLEDFPKEIGASRSLENAMQIVVDTNS